jgi:hypothetical protein
MPALKRAFLPVKYVLRLKEEATFLSAVKGGNIRGEVHSTPGSPRYYSRKHIAHLQVEDFTIHIGMAISKSLSDWINTSWRSRPPRFDGSVLACDFDLSIQSERVFKNALIREITIPALDASAKTPGLLSVRFSPEKVQYKKGEGKLDAPLLSKQKLWQSGNFRLEIENLDTSGVQKIDSFSISTSNTSPRTRKIDFPDLKISLSANFSEGWHEWFDDFVIHGNNGDDRERKGTLVFLSPDLQTELGRIDLHHLGIFALSPDESGTGDINKLTAELYCERMELKIGEGIP